MDLSAASDVERTHVRRDQCGVSAMQVIVTGSVIVKCERVTRLLPWMPFGENGTLFGSSSMKEGQVLTVFARSGLRVSATGSFMTHSKSFSAPLAVKPEIWQHSGTLGFFKLLQDLLESCFFFCKSAQYLFFLSGG